ncbi:MAG: HAMP domain-containing sensor histidine kinase [Rhodospirillales bacterium]
MNDPLRDDPFSEDSAYRENLRDFAHEIGTPLNAMIGYVQLAQKELESGGDPSKLADYLETIEQSTVRLLRICEHVLDDAIAGAHKVHKVVVNAVVLCEEVLSTFTEMAKKRGIDVVSDFPEDFPTVPTDPVLVGQVMTNLVSNAIKFTPPGGTITVKGEVDAEDNMMILMVRDTGKGIPASLMLQVRNGKKIATQSEHGDKGWGRGIQIATEIAERLGGELTFAPASTGGTVVRFLLPLDE